MKLKICLFISLFFALPTLAQDGPLVSVLDVYRVEVQELEGGDAEESLVPVEEAVPGDTLEYVLSYSNVGEQVLRGFVIKNKVPDNTQYVGESDSANIDAEFVVSIDYGATWETPPVTRVVTDSSGEQRTIVIPPEQYTNISWRVGGDLEPQGEFELRYRVVIQ